jgi:hypothetical protein
VFRIDSNIFFGRDKGKTTLRYDNDNMTIWEGHVLGIKFIVEFIWKPIMRTYWWRWASLVEIETWIHEYPITVLAEMAKLSCQAKKKFRSFDRTLSFATKKILSVQNFSKKRDDKAIWVKGGHRIVLLQSESGD